MTLTRTHDTSNLTAIVDANHHTAIVKYKNTKLKLRQNAYKAPDFKYAKIIVIVLITVFLPVQNLDDGNDGCELTTDECASIVNILSLLFLYSNRQYV